mgnify:CR=1 FL=1
MVEVDDGIILDFILGVNVDNDSGTLDDILVLDFILGLDDDVADDE